MMASGAAVQDGWFVIVVAFRAPPRSAARCEGLMPAPWPPPRPVQCVASPGELAKVIATTRSIIASGGGFLRPGRVASCKSPSPRSPYTAPASATLSAFRCRSGAGSRHRVDPIRDRRQHNPRPPDLLLRGVPRSDHGLQPLSVAQTKPSLNAFWRIASVIEPFLQLIGLRAADV